MEKKTAHLRELSTQNGKAWFYRCFGVMMAVASIYAMAHGFITTCDKYISLILICICTADDQPMTKLINIFKSMRKITVSIKHDSQQQPSKCVRKSKAIGPASEDEPVEPSDLAELTDH